MALVTRRGPNTPPNNTNPNNMTLESVQAMIDQALLRNSTNGDGSHRTEGVVDLTRWIEKMESVFQISGCAIENQVKVSTCTLLGVALTWWNGQIRTLCPDAYTMTWEILKKKMMNKYCLQGEIKKLEIELWNLKSKGMMSMKASKPKMLDETIELANDLMDQNLRTYTERNSGNTNVANTQRDNTSIPKGNVGNAEKKGNASRDPDSNVVTGNSYDVKLADGKIVRNEKEHEEHLKVILELLKKEKLYAMFSKYEFWIPKLTQKGIKFDWGEKEENAFQLIKQKLCSAPILALPKGSEDFVFYCDASHKGLGVVLMQREKAKSCSKHDQELEVLLVYETSQDVERPLQQ
nr:reverse transcriptase domain-containing protein [Tanacetum cinerariifolium]